jgi:hypothetical protein
MKKLLILFLMFGLLCPLAFAAGQSDGQQGTQDAGTGQELMTNTETATQNQGEASQIQTQQQIQVQSGSYTTENGKQLQVQEQSNNQVQLTSGGVSAQTTMQMTQTQMQTGAKIQVKLSNGQDSEIKIMPDAASETALTRLRLHVCNESNNCTIQLKEVGSGEQVKAAYEVQAQKQVKVLGLFRAQMQVQAQIDAENGEVIKAMTPWWSFLAVEE